jgi:hypothetical protein
LLLALLLLLLLLLLPPPLLLLLLLLPPPIIVNVLPLPVCPKAKIVQLKPFNTSVTIGAAAIEKTSSCVAVGAKTRSKLNEYSSPRRLVHVTPRPFGPTSKHVPATLAAVILAVVSSPLPLSFC